jgi:NAD(P)-dependent dehydrogenase (short-subunit alcohol dehydrogenase family)
MNGIDGSTGIVTGGGSGIGREAAVRFGEEGANVVIADVDGEGSSETAARVEEAGGEATVVETDVSDPDDVAAMVDVAVETYGGLDFAFNNAGIRSDAARTAEQSLENWERVIEVDLKGVFLCMRAELPAMLDSGGGAIVNTSSIAGVFGYQEVSPYVASKHGVIGLTKTAAVEYAEDDVRVNAICPGVIETPFVQGRIEQDPASIERSKAATPMGRLGQPEEIGDAAVWLCSEDASFVTGETLLVDGGFAAE